METNLPGFGRPLEHLPEWSRGQSAPLNRFPHAIADFFTTEGITRRECRMLDFINQITDKPRWTEKIHDESIVDKWREEACGTDEDWVTDPNRLSPKCFDYCLEELHDKAAYLQKYGLVHVLDCEAAVIKRDKDDGLCAAFIAAVRPLENVPDFRQDWHPGSDGLVLDLVHPSLFPLQYGRTRMLPNGTVGLAECSQFSGRGTTIAVPAPVKDGFEYTRSKSWGNDARLKPWGSFQWLPSEVKFRSDGTAAIDSYVNNLHPLQFPELYALLEKAVDEALPLWNECLSWFNPRVRINVKGCGWEDYLPPPPGWGLLDVEGNNVQAGDAGHEGTTGQLDDANMEDTDNFAPNASGEEDDCDSNDGSYLSDGTRDAERNRDWWENNPDLRKVMQPEPTQPFQPFEERVKADDLRKVDLRNGFPDGLQVIFKLANIHLTPEKPQYNGSNWHVEGVLNEHICATALLYYDQDNITDSYLEFRHEVDAQEMVCRPQQHEYAAAEDLFGITNEEAAVQDLGRVLTRAGRLLAFPNVMQHRIAPFGLRDPSKPGHRKILAMFLVDPHIRILSTANIPPQQRRWWAEEVVLTDRFAALPRELFDRIIEDVDDFPISWEGACEMRDALMGERGRMADDFDTMIKEDTFYFCEH